MKKVTSEFVRNIFYSGQFGFIGDREVTEKIAFFVNNNYLILTKISIATKEQYLEVCTNPAFASLRDDASGGSFEHVALKILGQVHIESAYGVWSKFEQSFAGYIPDVQSIVDHTICECGHTNNPEKLFAYFRHPEVRLVIQIPYPNDTDADIFGYEFQATPDLIPFLDYESESVSQSIKNILNNR